MIVKASDYCRDLPEECYDLLTLKVSDEDVSVPCDPSIFANGNGDIILEGIIAPGYANSKCTVVVPTKLFNELFTLEIEDDKELDDELRELLDEAGWEIEE